MRGAVAFFERGRFGGKRINPNPTRDAGRVTSGRVINSISSTTVESAKPNAKASHNNDTGAGRLPVYTAQKTSTVDGAGKTPVYVVPPLKHRLPDAEAWDGPEKPKFSPYHYSPTWVSAVVDQDERSLAQVAFERDYLSSPVLKHADTSHPLHKSANPSHEEKMEYAAAMFRYRERLRRLGKSEPDLYRPPRVRKTRIVKIHSYPPHSCPCCTGNHWLNRCTVRKTYRLLRKIVPSEVIKPRPRHACPLPKFRKNLTLMALFALFALSTVASDGIVGNNTIKSDDIVSLFFSSGVSHPPGLDYGMESGGSGYGYGTSRSIPSGYGTAMPTAFYGFRKQLYDQDLINMLDGLPVTNIKQRNSVYGMVPSIDQEECVFAFDKSGFLAFIDQKLRCPVVTGCPRLGSFELDERFTVTGGVSNYYFCTPYRAIAPLNTILTTYTFDAPMLPADVTYTKTGSSTATNVTIFTAYNMNLNTNSNNWRRMMNAMSYSYAVVCDESRGLCAVTSTDCINTLAPRVQSSAGGITPGVPRWWTGSEGDGKTALIISRGNTAGMSCSFDFSIVYSSDMGTFAKNISRGSYQMLFIAADGVYTDWFHDEQNGPNPTAANANYPTLAVSWIPGNKQPLMLYRACDSPDNSKVSCMYTFIAALSTFRVEPTIQAAPQLSLWQLMLLVVDDFVAAILEAATSFVHLFVTFHLAYVRFLIGDANVKDIIVLFVKFVTDTATLVSTDVQMVVEAFFPVITTSIGTLVNGVATLVSQYVQLVMSVGNLNLAATMVAAARQVVYECSDALQLVLRQVLVLVHDLMSIIMVAVVSAPYPTEALPPAILAAITYLKTYDYRLSAAVAAVAYVFAARFS